MRSSGNSGPGCLRASARGLGCLVLVVILVAVALGFDILNTPWAYPLFGRPTLSGHWVGTFTTPSGIRFALYLEIDHNPLTGPGSSELSGELFDGRAYWCDNQGRRVENAPLSGSVPMFSGYTGSVEPVAIHIEPSRTAPLGLWPVNLRGQWHLDTLTLQPNLVVFTGNSLKSSSSDPDQNQSIPIRMKKGELDAFQSACAQ